MSKARSLSEAHLFALLGAALVLTQRLALPIGESEIPLAPLIFVSIMTWMFFAGRVGISPLRLGVLSLFWGAGAISVLLASGSIFSIGLIGALWVGVIFAVSDPFRCQSSALAGFVTATAAAGALALIQSLVSRFSGYFLDPIGELPGILLLSGYNTTDPVEFGGDWMKSNGMFFLEPSFLSLMSAFSLVVLASGAVGKNWGSLHKGVAALALVSGFATAVAASGMVLLPALALAIAVSSMRNRLVVLIGALLGLSVLASTPLWGYLQKRVFTLDLEVGSNSSRLVRPYTELLLPWLQNGPILGNGAGSARDFVQAKYTGWQDEITTPTIVKLAYEYGFLGLLLTVILVFLIARGSKLPLPVKLALVLILFVPTDGLLSGLIANLVVLSVLAERKGITISMNYRTSEAANIVRRLNAGGSCKSGGVIQNE